MDSPSVSRYDRCVMRMRVVELVLLLAAALAGSCGSVNGDKDAGTGGSSCVLGTSKLGECKL
jgi:hypothetical protein